MDVWEIVIFALKCVAFGPIGATAVVSFIASLKR